MNDIIIDTHNKQNGILAEVESCRGNYIRLISEKLGLIMTRKNNELNKTIIEACNKFDMSPEQYLDKLLNCSNDSPLLEHLIAGITIGETYFFRDQNQMKIVREILLPQLIKKRRMENRLYLRIWSAGCSSGEEIYTIAMMLKEQLQDIDNWNLQLLGTDINIKLLRKAMRGQYGEWSMRSITNYYKNKYFIHEKNEYFLREEIKNLVRFDFINLNDAYYPSMLNATNAQDFIICRNVLIYFDNYHIKRLMKRLSSSLISDGYLLLGASDPMCTMETNLSLHQGKCSLYVNKVENIDGLLIVQNKVNSHSEQSEVSRTSDVIPRHAQNDSVCHLVSNESMITKLLSESAWSDVLEIINQQLILGRKSVFLLNAKATALANLGDLDNARKVCQESISIDPTNKYSYFIYALTLAELNQVDDSEMQLRKTLYLDRQFIMAHFQLGLLLFKTNRHAAAIRSLKNALTVAHANAPDAIVPNMPGLSYGRLTEILKNEMSLYIKESA